MNPPQDFAKRRRPAGWLAGGMALVFTLAFFWRAEPFAPEYEGLTVRGWIRQLAANHEFPKADLVRHFGASAVPALLAEIEPSGWFTLSLELDRLFRTARFDPLRSADFDRRAACANWAQLLLKVEPGIFERMLAATAEDRRAMAITRLFHGERGIRISLRACREQSTNEVLQARAGRLLDAYLGLDSGRETL